MSVLARRTREVYRVYDEREYMSGTASTEWGELQAPEAARRLGGRVAATAALLVVGSTSAALLAHGSRAPRTKRVATDRRSPAAALARQVASTSASRKRAAMKRTRPRRGRLLTGMQSEHHRRSPTQVPAAVVRQTPHVKEVVAAVRQGPAVTPDPYRSRRPEFGFER
jgi:hypothetical protein